MSPTETKDSCLREVHVEIPADVVTTQTDSLVRKYTKMARIPGFRRGKVPASIVRQRFADELKSELAESLVPQYFREETEKQGLKPISQPRVTDLHIHEGEPLRFKATFEVLPEIEVPGYKEVRVEHKDTSVSEQEVEDALKNIQEQHATYNAVEEERPVREGDFAQVSFEGVAKPAPAAEGAANEPPQDTKPVKVDEVMVEIGGTNTVKEFSENLTGTSAGDTREFEVAYPADFSDQRLAGKTMSYKVEVKGIKTKSVPELNDDFAKQVGEFETLEALRQRIRDGIKHEKEHQAEHEAKDKIVDELLKLTDFPVPESLVEHQIDLRLERGLRALAAQGMRAEDLRKMDWSRLRSGQHDQAVREVKAALVLDKIADLENLEVTDEEVDKEVNALAAQSRQSVEEVRARLTQDGAINRIRDRIRNEKALEFLYRRSA